MENKQFSFTSDIQKDFKIKPKSQKPKGSTAPPVAPEPFKFQLPAILDPKMGDPCKFFTTPVMLTVASPR